MKKVRTMSFTLPITREDLREANKNIARMHRKGENVKVEWKLNSA